jgi:Zn finger protein HypA/HybF involved in hydrogenase expression
MKRKQKPMYIGESCSFDDMIKNTMDKAKEAEEEFKRNGGMCLHCGKDKGDATSLLNPYNCKKCNKETQRILNQLSGSPGFMHLQIRKGKS